MTTDIEDHKFEQSLTKRPTVAAMEEILQVTTPVLNHGFIRVIDYMGDDASVVQAARVSYGRGTRKTSEDETLIRYLMRHKHSTPFEMNEYKVHLRMPIFVARQWIRHRTASINEYSARYSVLDKEFYIPAPENLAAQSTSNKQGRSEILPPDQAQRVLDILRDDAARNYDHYEWMLNEGEGRDESRLSLARELARINLTLSSFTQFYWKTNAHNLMHFLRLRADSHAQYEIRVYAEIMLQHLEFWMPMTYRAFREYHMDAVCLSKTMWRTVQRMLAGEHVDQPSSGMTKREWDDLQSYLLR